MQASILFSLAALFSATAASPVSGELSVGEPKPLVARDLFASTCWDLNVPDYDKGRLNAMCKDTNGNPHSTNIDLRRCLVNVDGNLLGRENGSFDRSCDMNTCATNNVFWYQCLCASGSDPRHYSAVNLNGVLTNDNGVLRCYGHTGNDY